MSVIFILICLNAQIPITGALCDDEFDTSYEFKKSVNHNFATKALQEKWCRLWQKVLGCTVVTCPNLHENACSVLDWEKNMFGLKDVKCWTFCDPPLTTTTTTPSPEMKQSSAAYSVMKPSALLAVFTCWMCLFQ